MEIEVVSDAPDSFSQDERRRFRVLVEAGGEVDTVVLHQNVESAKSLVFAWSEGRLLGVAALKVPQPSYRKKIAQNSGFSLQPELYPFELGYVFVQEEARGIGLAHRLVAAAVDQARRTKVFATVRADNLAMLSTLHRAAFLHVGEEYPGRNQGTSIRLLVRNT